MNPFIVECVLAEYNTEIHMKHTIDIIDGMRDLEIDIYFWKYCRLIHYKDGARLDTNNPYYKLIAVVQFRNISHCYCSGCAFKEENIQTTRRVGHPTIESMTSLVSEMMDMLKNIKFDKQSGTFTKNAIETSEECCICLEPTQTKTNCGHHLCIPCWNKINAKCPICRKEDICMYCDYCS